MITISNKTKNKTCQEIRLKNYDNNWKERKINKRSQEKIKQKKLQAKKKCELNGQKRKIKILVL